MSLNKRVVLLGTVLFILACLFPYKEQAPYRVCNIPSGFYFITTDTAQCETEVCKRAGWKGCEQLETETRTYNMLLKKDVFTIELIAILFGTLGLAFVLGKDKRGK